MRRLILEGEYFSVEEMKRRDPLLFEEMIGKYQTNEDVAEAVATADLSLSEVLLRHLQAVQNNELYEQQQQSRTVRVLRLTHHCHYHHCHHHQHPHPQHLLLHFSFLF